MEVIREYTRMYKPQQLWIPCISRYDAINTLLIILHFYFLILKQFSPLLASISFIFPKSLRSLQNGLHVNRNSFIKFIVCPKCHSIYNLDNLLTSVENVCTYCEYPHHPHRARRKPCGTKLVAKIKLKDGSLKVYPHKMYCYKSLTESLKLLFSRPGVLSACEKWRQRTIPSNALHDIYDGRVWKEFMHVNNTPFLAAPNKIGLMLNVDWFNPYKHSPYSVGVIYLVILNLPRSMRFKKRKHYFSWFNTRSPWAFVAHQYIPWSTCWRIEHFMETWNSNTITRCT